MDAFNFIYFINEITLIIFECNTNALVLHTHAVPKYFEFRVECSMV